MRVLVCGDRNWDDVWSIHRELLKLLSGEAQHSLTIIHGCARGADSITGMIARRMAGIPVMEFPAQWKKYGKAAGPIRNQQMLDEGKPDLVLAFHKDLANSKGTKDMVTRARKAGIEVRIFIQ